MRIIITVLLLLASQISLALSTKNSHKIKANSEVLMQSYLNLLESESIALAKKVLIMPDEIDKAWQVFFLSYLLFEEPDPKFIELLDIYQAVNESSSRKELKDELSDDVNPLCLKLLSFDRELIKSVTNSLVLKDSQRLCVSKLKANSGDSKVFVTLIF